jgi:hypothetical protein
MAKEIPQKTLFFLKFCKFFSEKENIVTKYSPFHILPNFHTRKIKCWFPPVFKSDEERLMHLTQLAPSLCQ